MNQNIVTGVIDNFVEFGRHSKGIFILQRLKISVSIIRETDSYIVTRGLSILCNRDG